MCVSLSTVQPQEGLFVPVAFLHCCVLRGKCSKMAEAEDQQLRMRPFRYVRLCLTVCVAVSVCTCAHGLCCWLWCHGDCVALSPLVFVHSCIARPFLLTSGVVCTL